jgi:phage host-nuclease inhibitor protein Gam
MTREKTRGDAQAVAQIQDQLAREVRRLHTEWEEKKAHVYAETPADESDLERLKTESPAADLQEPA